jgi:hypothetical protein
MRLSISRFLPVLVVVLVAGCTSAVSVRPPAAVDIDRVKAGDLAVVLFQVRTAIDGKILSPLGAADANRHSRIYLASLGELNAPAQIASTSPSESAAVDGWRYLLLPPGTYYLLILPPGVEQNPPAVAFHAPSARFGRLTQYQFESGRGGFWSPELTAFVFSGAPPQDFRDLPGFWFEVPKDKPVVYPGTLSAACSSGRGLLGDLIDSCSDYAVTIDSRAAQRVATIALPGLGPVDTQPLAVYGKARGGTPVRGLINVAMQSSATLDVVYSGARMGPWNVIPGAPPVYNLLVVAEEAASRGNARQAAEKHAAAARPCMTKLAGALPGIDYASLFSAALVEAVGSRGAGPIPGSEREFIAVEQGRRTPQQLTFSIPVLQLRESSQAQDLALELGVHLRLEDNATRTVLYNSLLSYSRGFPVENPLAQRSRLYERLVPQQAQTHPLSDWCGTDGPDLLRGAIETGLQAIAGQFVLDLE